MGRDEPGNPDRTLNPDIRLSESTTTPLGGGASFTGATKLSQGFGRIVGSVFADQAGTLNVEQTNDGANFDVVSSFPVVANTGQGFSVEVVSKQWRLRYVNDGVAQGAFRLFGLLRGDS